MRTDKLHFAARRALPSFRPLFIFIGIFAMAISGDTRVRQSMNADWLFIRSNPAGAEASAFSDATWDRIGIPHTFNYTDAFDQKGSTACWAIKDNNVYYYSGVTWYRKHFKLPPAFSTQRIYLEFEGVSQVADVYVNGQRMGQHKGGAVPFVFDITKQCHFGNTENILAVKVDNTNTSCFGLPGAMFWTGDRHGGIVRDVWLHVVNPVHIPVNVYSYQMTWGTYVAATKVTIPTSAEVTMLTRVKNSETSTQTCRLLSELLNAGGVVVASSENSVSIDTGKFNEFNQVVTVANPHLWSPEDPYLYSVRSTVYAGGAAVDQFFTPLGIYTYRFDAANGFFLNGSHYKLFGFGMRQGGYGGLLNAISKYLQEKDVRLCKEAGANFMRTGHCAFDPAILDACDRLGIFNAAASACCELNWNDRYTEDPTGYWNFKKEFTRDIFVRDRNHPSVLLWEWMNGNITAAQATELNGMRNIWDNLSLRPSIAAANNNAGVPGSALDVMGTHAGGSGRSWNDAANKPMMMLEWGWNYVRSAFRTDWDSLTVKALTTVSSAVTNFDKYDEWAGWTYWAISEGPGESHGAIPGVGSELGALDANGHIPKPDYFCLKTIYSKKPALFILGHWNYSTGSTRTVDVISSSHPVSVRLFLNGSLVSAKNPVNKITEWTGIGWQYGKLLAVGYDGSGTEIARDSLVTAGAPNRIVLTVDPDSLTADGSDCAIVFARVVDAQGVVCPTDSTSITFATTGEVNWRGGFNHRIEFTHGNRTLKAEAGQMAVAIRATNTPSVMSVTASATGLASGTVSLRSYPADAGVPIVYKSVTPSGRSGGIIGALRVLPHSLDFKVSLTGESRVSVDLLDLDGRKLADLWSGTLTEGTHTVTCFRKAGSTSAGTKILRVRTGGKMNVTGTRKVVLVGD